MPKRTFGVFASIRVAAFDVDGEKVGQDLSAAILAGVNNTIKIAEVPPAGVKIRGDLERDPPHPPALLLLGAF